MTPRAFVAFVAFFVTVSAGVHAQESTRPLPEDGAPSLTRPLFSASRRPPPVTAPEPRVIATPPPPVATMPAVPNWVLIGTLSSEGVRHALVRDQAGRRTIRVRVGEQYDGWTLREVAPRSARFENGPWAAVIRFPSGIRAAQ